MIGAIDGAALLKMFIASLVAGIGSATIFAIALLGAIRSGDMRRVSRSGAATAYAALAVVGFLVVAAIVVYGVILVSRK